MTPEQKEAFRREVLEEAAGVAERHAKGPARRYTNGRLANRTPVTSKPLALQGLRIAREIRALAAIPPTLADDTERGERMNAQFNRIMRGIPY